VLNVQLVGTGQISSSPDESLHLYVLLHTLGTAQGPIYHHTATVSTHLLYSVATAKIGLIHTQLLCTATLGLQLGLQTIFAKASTMRENILF
jgi:hypothetical protein